MIGTSSNSRRRLQRAAAHVVAKGAVATLAILATIGAAVAVEAIKTGGGEGHGSLFTVMLPDSTSADPPAPVAVAEQKEAEAARVWVGGSGG